jgi:protein-tyrosine phosphatase
MMYHTIDADPTPLYQGPLPTFWSDVPARVIVNLCGAYPKGKPGDRKVFDMPLLDVQETGAIPHRTRFEAFLAGVHAHAQHEASYWHCHAGLNRSSLGVAAYLHLYRGYRIGEAIATIRRKRSGICLCNSLFEETLRVWYGEADEQAFEPVDVQAWLEARTGGREDWS